MKLYKLFFFKQIQIIIWILNFAHIFYPHRCIMPLSSCKLFLKCHLKKLKLSVLVRSLSVIQPFNHPLTFNFPKSLGYIRKLAFRSLWGNYFTLGFVCIHKTAPSNILHRQGTNSHLGRVEPRRFISCALRNSR